MFEVWTKIRNKLFGTLWKWIFRWDFFHFGSASVLLRPRRIQGARWISIGSGVTVLDSAWLLVLPPRVPEEARDARLSVGDGTQIGHFSHIVAMVGVHIGNRVMIADRVYISDNTHTFHDLAVPVMDQPVAFRSRVEIADGAWIGENACIVGASVGRNSVVAANSLVTKDVPDFCVVAGVPARIVQRLG